MELPSFENPPLVEVVVGIQFEHLPLLTSARIGAFWSELGQEFSGTEDQPPLPPITERFGQPDIQPISFQVHSAYQPLRVWFVNEDRTKIIQVQPDRFLFNWRKADGANNEYPRFSIIRETFLQQLERLIQYVENNNLGKVIPTYCEVSYVNHILPNQEWKRHADFENVFTVMRVENPPRAEVSLEQSGFSLVYTIKDAQEKAIGRLRTVSYPAFDLPEYKPIYKLDLIARGYPVDKKDINGVKAFLDIGHTEIVLNFDSVTSPEMHKIWRKQHASAG